MEVVDVRVEELVADEAAPSSPLTPRAPQRWVCTCTHTKPSGEGGEGGMVRTHRCSPRPPLRWHAAKPDNVITSFPSYFSFGRLRADLSLDDPSLISR